MDVKILLAVLSCLALTNGQIMSGVFIPADAFRNLNNNNNQVTNDDATNQIQHNSDQGVQNSVLGINPTNQQPHPSESLPNQQQNQQPIIVRQIQPLQSGAAQPNQPRPVVVGQPSLQPSQVIIGQPNQQGMLVVQPNQPNQPAVIYNPSSNQPQVIVAKPPNQEQILVSQPGQQAVWVKPGDQQTVFVSQPNQVQVSPSGPNGQQHGQALLIPKPGENYVYTFIPLNNQNQAVSNGNTIWVPVQ